eukprot:TRINITY_DN30985_c0_g1_i1.p1 TRINITY_DN30985_c0_g1~~TRINITY_DN30985_c0_g1_i1.p1  ORF type:complete len:292 (+),score=66.91 TRINITY_DN30985_c0_g1_i1:34-909(+)
MPAAVDETCEALRSLRNAKIEALTALRESGESNREHAISEVCSRLKDEDSAVCQAAVRALPDLVEEGHQGAIAALAECLEDGTWDASAADSAPQLADLADHGEAVLLEDQLRWVRCAALRALAQIAERGDRTALRVVASRLKDPDSVARRAAVRALGQLAELGDPGSVGLVTEQLQDEDPDVRQTAVRALAELRRHGDRASAAAMARLLADADSDVQQAASDALAELAAGGDSAAAEVLAGKSTATKLPKAIEASDQCSVDPASEDRDRGMIATGCRQGGCSQGSDGCNIA